MLVVDGTRPELHNGATCIISSVCSPLNMYLKALFTYIIVRRQGVWPKCSVQTIHGATGSLRESAVKKYHTEKIKVIDRLVTTEHAILLAVCHIIKIMVHIMQYFSIPL